MHGLPVTHLLPAGLVHSSTIAATAARSAVETRVSMNNSADSRDDSVQPGRLDPMVMLCPFELDGKCNDYECAYQHLQGGRRAAPLCVPLPTLQLPGYSTSTADTTAGTRVAHTTSQQQQAGKNSAAAAAGSVQVPSKAKRTRDAAAAASSDGSSAAAAHGESQQQQQQSSKRRKAANSHPATSPAVTAAADIGFVDASEEAEQQQHDDTSSSAEAESVATWLAQFAAAASSLHSGHRSAAAAGAHQYAAFTSESDTDSSVAALQELSDKQQAALKKHLATEPTNCAAWMLLALHKLPCPAPRSTSTSSSTKLSSTSSSVSAGREQSAVLLATDRLHYLEKLLRRNSRQQQHKAGSSSSSSSSSGTSNLKHALVVLSSALTHVPNRLHSGLWMLYLQLFVLHGGKMASVTEHAFTKLPLCLPLWQFVRIHGAVAAASSAGDAVVAVSDVAALCVKRLHDLCVLLERQREQADGSAFDSFSAHKMLLYVLLDRTQLLVSTLLQSKACWQLVLVSTCNITCVIAWL
jgi:Putative zinc-finger domain